MYIYLKLKTRIAKLRKSPEIHLEGILCLVNCKRNTHVHLYKVIFDKATKVDKITRKTRLRYIA